MKHILLVIIKAYWLLIPKQKRNRCIFSESCSTYVFRITKNQGLLKGLQALKLRFKSCRTGYQIITINNEEFLLTVNHQLFKKSEMRDDLN